MLSLNQKERSSFLVLEAIYLSIDLLQEKQTNVT